MSVDFDNFSWDSMKDNLQSNINGKDGQQRYTEPPSLHILL